jgi:tripartite-type tricarboxylate transporter receptor subunit TctC
VPQALAADIGALVKGGRARLLAVSGATRDPAFPDVPTFKERLSKAAMAALKDPAVNQKMLGIGLQPTGYGPEELARIMKADYDKWGPVIRASGFKP